MSSLANASIVQERAAVLSHIVYADKSKWADELRRYGLSPENGYTLDTQLSRDNTLVLTRAPGSFGEAKQERKGELIVAHRGTQLHHGATTAIGDLATDAGILFNRLDLTPRYQAAKRTTQEAMAKYQDHEVITTGHSLGGSIATHLGHDLGIQSHSFNPGVSIVVLQHQIRRGHRMLRMQGASSEESKHHIYITRGDAISNSGVLGIRGTEHVHLSQPTADGHHAHGLAHWMPVVATE